MVDFLSSLAKNLAVVIIIVSILEILLPNNKNKKYIKVVMSIYVLFTIISPFIDNDDIINLNYLSDVNTYIDITNANTSTNYTSNLDQSSMNETIANLYIEELDKDITSKLEEMGYIVNNVDISVSNFDYDTIDDLEINSIILDIEVNNTILLRRRNRRRK